MMRLRGITSIIMLALVLGFAIPLGTGVFVMQQVERRLLEDELHRYHRKVTAALADSARDALVSFSPSRAQSIAAALMHDHRLIRIDIYSATFEMPLAIIKRHVESSLSKPISLRQNIAHSDENLGYVEVTIDLNSIAPLVDDKRDDLFILFVCMLIVGLILVIPTIYFIVLRPLQKLTRQAQILGTGNFDSPLTWTGSNEISVLGTTLETMRKSLSDSFNEIQKMATIDDLTGIPNRRAFISGIGRLLMLCKRHRKPLSIAMVDIDLFKKINDTWGHVTGDVVLAEFAELVSTKIRKSDLFARFGGEEFVLCMPETPIENAHILVEKIRETVEQHTFADELKITVSFGLAEFTESESLETLISNADLALYDAKQAGRNRISCWPID